MAQQNGRAIATRPSRLASDSSRSQIARPERLVCVLGLTAFRRLQGGMSKEDLLPVCLAEGAPLEHG